MRQGSHQGRRGAETHGDGGALLVLNGMKPRPEPRRPPGGKESEGARHGGEAEGGTPRPSGSRPAKRRRWLGCRRKPSPRQRRPRRWPAGRARAAAEVPQPLRNHSRPTSTTPPSRDRSLRSSTPKLSRQVAAEKSLIALGKLKSLAEKVAQPGEALPGLPRREDGQGSLQRRDVRLADARRRIELVAGKSAQSNLVTLIEDGTMPWPIPSRSLRSRSFAIGSTPARPWMPGSIRPTR